MSQQIQSNVQQVTKGIGTAIPVIMELQVFKMKYYGMQGVGLGSHEPLHTARFVFIGCLEGLHWCTWPAAILCWGSLPAGNFG